MKRLLNYLIAFYKSKIIKDKQFLALHKWFKDKGDETLRINYLLNKNSIVLDVGGYKGDWSAKISKRYNSRFYIFEPIPEYCSKIIKRFAKNKKASIFCFGLSDKNENKKIFIDKSASSVYGKTKRKKYIQLKDINKFLLEENIKSIDLIKINIEGGEYVLLQRMIDKGIIKNCKNILIQFHKFYPNAGELREKIRKSLQKTHFLTYDYFFVWENWKIKKE